MQNCTSDRTGKFTNYNAKGSACLSGEYRCKDRVTCVQKTWLCDGERDCPGGDDEMPPNCHNITCRADQFQCKDQSCIPGHLLCSGKPECVDGSDELNCNIESE